jgi:hypothetical protein
VYYKIFRPEGAIPCKQPVKPRDLYLARIEAAHITPPQTVASMIRCMLKKEEFDSFALKSELFEASSSLAPMEQEKHLAIMSGSGPGSDRRKPLALVIADAFDKKICATIDCSEWTECASDWILAHFLWEGYGEGNSRWLSFARGDILHTDGILRRCVVGVDETSLRKQMSSDYHKILTGVQATFQNTNTVHIGLAIALVVSDVRTN